MATDTFGECLAHKQRMLQIKSISLTHRLNIMHSPDARTMLTDTLI